MDGDIRVHLTGLETEYTATCACGWESDVQATIEWADVTLSNHFVRAHTEVTA